jgi:hypothetical protein
VDTDGDLAADRSLTFVFSELSDGVQTGTVRYATDAEARRSEPSGDLLVASTPVGFGETAQPVAAGRCRLFMGVRSDPFFADAEGAFHGFKWTGVDTFAGKNILSIALEIPNDMLFGEGPRIGVWAAVSIRRAGVLVQVDRGGHPTINPFINPNESKDEYNARQPAEDVENYLEPWSKLLQQNGYSPADAATAALTVLPDILTYDRTEPVAYPNGRALSDDVFSARMAFLTNGEVTSDGLAPHDDLGPSFPFLGAPHVVAL